MLSRRSIVFCVAVFVVARVGFSLIGWIGIGSTVEPPTGDGSATVVEVGGTGREVPATPGVHNVVDAGLRWDATWYVSIAEHGYEGRPTAAFFPGYVLAVRATDAILPIGVVGSAVLVSNAAFLLALLALFRLTLREFGGDELVARRAVLLLTFYPTSFFFLAPYAESLFLLLALLSFGWARSGRWLRAGIAGAFAWAARSVGGILSAALVVEAWGERKGRPTRVAAAVLPVAGLAAYVAWWGLGPGDVMAPFGAQDVWHRDATVPLVTLGRGVAVGLRAITDAAWLPELGDVVMGIAPLALLAAGWRRLPSLSYGVFVALGFLVPLSFAVPERPFLSLPRFVIVLFPLAWLAATLPWAAIWHRVVLAVCVVGWIGLSLAFVNWRFVA